MLKKISIALIGLIIGVASAVYFMYFQNQSPIKTSQPKQVIGFLPYWLLNEAKASYAGDITTLTYFSLDVGSDGHIVKLASPQQDEPGWYALYSGKINPFFADARKNNIKLSLAVASGDTQAIDQMINKPTQNANNLITDIVPLMKTYHFQDLNLDIEDSAAPSQAQQTNFVQFIKTIKEQMDERKLGTLTVEVTPNDLIFPNLINLQTVAPYVDNIVIMAYDYHASVSSVTGAVAPLNGAGVDSEYDVTTAVEKALQMAPSEKIILGMPLYGYEWQTLSTAIHSAIIPGTALTASNNRMQSFLSSCTTCSTFFDNESQEEFVVYQDQSSGTYHQFYFPTQQTVESTINLANEKQLSGVALWALGYEGNGMLSPLTNYK